jgi:hypothetical protein
LNRPSFAYQTFLAAGLPVNEFKRNFEQNHFATMQNPEIFGKHYGSTLLLIAAETASFHTMQFAAFAKLP